MMNVLAYAHNRTEEKGYRDIQELILAVRGLEMDGKNNISPSLEDYLEAILHLKEENTIIRVTDLAKKLQVAKSSVNQAVTKLTEKKLLTHERYGPLELTDLGAMQARKINERHQLLKYFFNAILRVDEQIAEKDACNIEHYISAITLEKLVDFLASLTGSESIQRREEFSCQNNIITYFQN